MKLTCVVICLFVGSLVAQNVDPDYAEFKIEDDYYDPVDKIVDRSNNEEQQDANVEVPEPVNSQIVDDYQIEDNRSGEKIKSNDGEEVAEKILPNADEEPMADDGDIGELPFVDEEPRMDNGFEELKGEEKDDDDDILDNIEHDKTLNAEGMNESMFEEDYPWGDFEDDMDAPVPEGNEKIFEETRNILEEDSQSNFDDQLQQNSFENGQSNINNDESDVNIEQIDENDKDIDQIGEKPSASDSNENVDGSDEDIQEDTVDKVYADLNSDLDKLFETLSNLKEDETEENEGDEQEINIQDYEDKYNRPYKETAILSARGEDYSEIGDSNLSEIFNENAVDDDTSAEEFDSGDNDNLNENIENLNNEGNKPVNQLNSELEEHKPDNVLNKIDKALEYMDETVEDDSDADDSLLAEIKEIFDSEPAPYGNDGLVAEGQPKEVDAEVIESFDSTMEDTDDDIEEQNKEAVVKAESTTETAKTKMVDELSSAEFEDIMAQFVIAHQEDLDVKSEDFDKHVAPIHITLSVDKPTVVTSPNYPDNYPTNNIIDWIFEGEGRGIELNITDFAVNGALGDYLLVKPGGVDASGTDGLIFSYRLNSERRYRFTDVNRMFVRFEAKLGMSFMRGFQFSVRSILPPLERVEQIPEPETVVEPPQHTLTVNLAGLTVAQFNSVQETFRGILADMARQYINENEIYYGYNTTLEVTQITRTAVCSIHLPEYETCVQVTFGVPLNYGDFEVEPRLNAEDLEDMWNTLADDDMYAERMAVMGIKEYLLPNDRAVVTVWLVIAAGVVISMALLGFALWRFSCFEDYTRMRSFSDNESVSNEKRNLDLYPTPHQTLPPLYSESEYKWGDDDSTRVDMGGFANKSYARDELFDFESDEEVIASRDRYATNV